MPAVNTLGLNSTLWTLMEPWSWEQLTDNALLTVAEIDGCFEQGWITQRAFESIR
jgi:hypothetical protein